MIVRGHWSQLHSARVVRVLALALGICQSAAAQTLAGRVLDRATRLPLGLVDVRLLPDTGGSAPVLARTTTDSSGIFYLDAPAPGAYRIAFEATKGYEFLAPVRFASKEEVLQHEFLLEITTSRTYFEFEVEKQVKGVPGNRPPRYPDRMRNARVEGEVLIQFVVDSLGVPDMNSVKVLRSTYPDFTMAVRTALPEFRFYPAQIAGRPVRQRVQMPFEFCLNMSPLPTFPLTGEFAWLRQQRPRKCLNAR